HAGSSCGNGWWRRNQRRGISMTSRWIRTVCVAAAGTMFATFASVNTGSAQNAPEIVLGAVVPSSGPFAEWGRANTVTLQMLEKQVNDAGGVNGAKLRIVILDDAARPALAANNVRKLSGDDKVLAIAGPLTSS